VIPTETIEETRAIAAEVLRYLALEGMRSKRCRVSSKSRWGTFAPCVSRNSRGRAKRYNGRSGEAREEGREGTGGAS